MPAASPSDRVMWVTPSRIAYRGLFGRPDTRRFGAWFFYVGLDKPFVLSLDSQPATQRWIALVPPYTPHRVATADRSLGQVLLESETIGAQKQLRALIEGPARARQTRRRILEGFDRAVPEPEAFDAHFFGVTLAKRAIDPRIARIIETLGAAQDGDLSAKEWAAHLGVTASHFTHLFTDQAGCAFRRIRAWKRARSLLPIVDSQASLVDIALDIGYADSTHFSHAIRQHFGYKPSDIFAGSRRLSVVSNWSRQPLAA
ncbi:MAG: AraC family transcriptional regulator [Salinisphaera sp.]|nr:AraC family transcriptional regulator [Salinisphaera sp.]